MILNNIIINISENVSGKQGQCINMELIFYFISYFLNALTFEKIRTTRE